MQAVFVPVGGIPGHSRKFKQSVSRIKFVVTVGVSKAQQNFRTVVFFRVISMLNNIEGSIDKRHSLRIAPFVRDHFHDDFGRLPRTGKCESK